MKLIKYDPVTDASTYEHKGVTFRCTSSSVSAILHQHHFNVFAHVQSAIDKMFVMVTHENQSTNFSVGVKVTMDKVESDEIKTGISIVKIPRWVD